VHIYVRVRGLIDLYAGCIRKSAESLRFGKMEEIYGVLNVSDAARAEIGASASPRDFTRSFSDETHARGAEMLTLKGSAPNKKNNPSNLTEKMSLFIVFVDIFYSHNTREKDRFSVRFDR
jgi:hypothetical protein